MPLFPGQAMALRLRSCLPEPLLAGFDYRPGFPVDAFPVDVLTEFMVRACRRHGLAGLDKRTGAFLSGFGIRASGSGDAQGDGGRFRRAGIGWSSGGSCRPSRARR